jgi:hypothetical protein
LSAGVSLLLAAVSLAPAATITRTIDRRPPVNQYCPIDNVDYDLTFVAEQPYAQLTIQAFNTTAGGGTWIQNRVDNIAVIDKAGYDAHLVAPPGFQTCYAAPGDPNAPALDFNASGTFERYLTMFDTNATGWDLNSGAYFQSGVSAPRSPALGNDTTGGTMALGLITAGDVVVSTTIRIPNLTPGTQYVVTGWWYAKDTSRPLTIKIDTAPCTDDDLDGVSDCDGDCGIQDPGIKPGAVERCDGVDNDCDGQVDEGASCDKTCDVPQPLVGGGRLSSTTVGSTIPTILWIGNRYAVMFMDANSSYDPYVAFASAAGTQIGIERPLLITPGNDSARAVWTGNEIAVLRSGAPGGPQFQRFDRDGRPIAPAIPIGYGSYFVWTGKEYGRVTNSSGFGFQRLAPDGTPLTPSVLLGGVALNSSSFEVAWNGTHYGVVWLDGPSWDDPVMKFRRITPTSIGSGSVVNLGTTPGKASTPVIAAGGGTFGIAWSDRSINPSGDIYFTRVGSGGAQIGPILRVTSAAGGAIDPAIAWSGSEWGIVWDDTRTGNEEIWFARIDANGVKVGSDFQVSNAPGHSRNPSIVWAGGKYGIAWSDDRDGGNDEIYFTPLGCDCVDGDGDGASSCVDCADTDASLYPGAPSPCNGTTNLDCNSAYWPYPAPIADLDGDGLSPCAGDCDDAALNVFPGAAQICDGLNNDCSSPSWPSPLGTSDVDLDFDGVAVCENDCSDTDAAIWATPSEVALLRVFRLSSVTYTTLMASTPSSKGATSVLYDILRAPSASNFVAGAVCIASDSFQQTHTDADVPAPGGAYFYLARAENACPNGIGVGSLGASSAGIPRAGRTCP